MNTYIKSYQKRAKMVKLHNEQGGKCAICGCQTEIQEKGKTKNKDNTATFGHIYDKRDLRRFCIGGGKIQLECFKCNNGKDMQVKIERHNFYKSIIGL